MNTLLYPAFQGYTSQRSMSNGWSYYHENGQEILAQNWAAKEEILHANSRKAWDGRAIYDSSGRPVSQVDLVDPLGPSGEWGYLWLRLKQDFGKIDLHFEVTLNLLRLSYIHPISFVGKNQFPPIPFKDEFNVEIETGYWGELLIVHVGRNGLQFKFEQLPPPPPPYPYPPYPPGTGHQPCPHAMASNQPVADPAGFVRKQRR